VRRVALPLGFDAATMKQPGQMTRLPGAIRDGKPQRVVALDMGAACFADWEAENPAPKDEGEAWPFNCLGFDETRFWFLPLDTMRPVSMQAGDLTSKGKLLGIHTDGGWWASVFPNKDDNGADYSRAGTVLRERCVAAGYWDAAKQADTLRGRGLWLDGGSVVFNSGVAGRLLVDGAAAPAGWRSPTGRTYLSGGTLDLADSPLTDDEALAFVRLLSVQAGSEAAATICAVSSDRLNGLVQTEEKPNAANVERHMKAASLKDGQKNDIRDMTKKHGPHIEIGGRTVWTPGQKRPNGS
jgi:hypothetical protein